MKHYLLQYWAYNENDETTTVLRSKEVLASDETVNAMLGDKKHQYLRFIINDGQDFIISVDCVHSLTTRIPD
ncbi:hypothetical protein [Liquorilactobacillus nagelii]|uniref:hypothetical protein n=1 Tax=Liquorilactobacillus nagelii TaxID=82688 RepID=UPI00070D6D09|nr:hypothetical protein [Liquorilactobacillus nagelii]QYH53688.1 hypothetical protein G6O73_02825 [Liquorilactobacillus nagelii DSM 13675]